MGWLVSLKAAPLILTFWPMPLTSRRVPTTFRPPGGTVKALATSMGSIRDMTVPSARSLSQKARCSTPEQEKANFSKTVPFLGKQKREKVVSHVVLREKACKAL